MNSLRHGSGVFKSSCEQYYEGEWHEGKRHGQGKMIYNKHGTVSYSGEWCNGNRQGYGIMRYARYSLTHLLTHSHNHLLTHSLTQVVIIMKVIGIMIRTLVVGI